jgi:putative Ca2+/H+ antiporter (TMEM165/GDT1 family)
VLGTLAAVFGVIFLLELPDKTMVATVVMSARSRPTAVFTGASGAFIVQMALAALAGGLMSHLPTTPKLAIETALFLGGAAYLLLVRESDEKRRGEERALREQRSTFLAEGAAAFGIVFLAEFGDLTQIQAANFVVRTHEPFEVFGAASAALLVAAALAAFVGQRVTRYVPLDKIRMVGGLVFLGLGGYSLAQLVGT